MKLETYFYLFSSKSARNWSIVSSRLRNSRYFYAYKYYNKIIIIDLVVLLGSRVRFESYLEI